MSVNGRAAMKSSGLRWDMVCDPITGHRPEKPTFMAGPHVTTEGRYSQSKRGVEDDSSQSIGPQLSRQEQLWRYALALRLTLSSISLVVRTCVAPHGVARRSLTSCMRSARPCKTRQRPMPRAAVSVTGSCQGNPGRMEHAEADGRDDKGWAKDEVEAEASWMGVGGSGKGGGGGSCRTLFGCRLFCSRGGCRPLRQVSQSPAACV